MTDEQKQKHLDIIASLLKAVRHNDYAEGDVIDAHERINQLLRSSRGIVCYYVG